MLSLFILGFLCLQPLFLSDLSYAGQVGYDDSNALQNRKAKQSQHDSVDQWRFFLNQRVSRISPHKLNQRLEELYLRYQWQLSWQQVEVLLDFLNPDFDQFGEGLYSKANVERRVISLYYRIYFDVLSIPQSEDLIAMRARFKRASRILDRSIRRAVQNENDPLKGGSANPLMELERGRLFLLSHLQRSFTHLEEFHVSAKKIYLDLLFDSDQRISKLNELDQILVYAMNSLRSIEMMMSRMEYIVSYYERNNSLGSNEALIRKFELELGYLRSHYLKLSYRVVRAIQSLSSRAHRIKSPKFQGSEAYSSLPTVL